MSIPFADNHHIDKIRKGDIGAFEILFKQYYKKLCIYAEDFVKEKSMAEEIVSDVFYKIWENKENLNITGSPQAYLYTSVQNTSIKYLEHLKVLKKYNEFATNALQNKELLYPTSDQYPIANLISQEIETEINQAIGALPDQCRQIFCMHRFDDLSYEEIASKLGLSINTVRTQMMRALKKLRESLREYLPILVGLIFFFN